ncbi:MlaD family protein [Mycobacterium intracellulare]|uniref:MlaD family protein n=1 Tax=Mycobacterium intracellulare TaxID=1767 RepID=UPI0009F85857|nr:MlaD family protein [Mycobacterium intracellulare]MCV7323027.1 MCE family protein [Mycobacterium intracellulare subsp. chimaera]
MTASAGSRRVYRVAAIALAAAAVAAGSSCAPRPETPHAGYCAIMPDSTGLYVGNPVTQMGYQIGKVTTITPGALDVRVGFTVTEPRLLPGDVKAIIRSTSILADRSLELVGNYESGPELPAGGCIPLTRSSTPKSLSEMIGSATVFLNSVNPDGSTNIGDAVHEFDQAIHNNGSGVNRLLSTASGILDRPDQAISDIGSIIINLAHLTSILTEIRGPLKEILHDARKTTPDISSAVQAGARIVDGVSWVAPLVADLEVNLGQETQFTLDTVGVSLRKLSAHAPELADLLNPVPWWINTVANHFNNRPFSPIRYRPPLYRIRTPDGVALCNIMNASTPGSCANVQGQPYAVDVALLQYVLSQAATR